MTWVDTRIVMTPSESIHATPDSGSRYAASTNCVVYSPSTTTAARANAAAESPRAMRQWASRLPASWTRGAPGARAASGSNTPGSGSYWTSIASAASRACSRVSAATSATGSPWWRTRSVASTCSVARSGPTAVVCPGTSVASVLRGTSLAVRTAATPAIAKARPVSSLTMRAEA